MHAITFQKGTQASIVSTKEDLIKEINYYKCFWLSSTGTEYTNHPEHTVKIKVTGLTPDLRQWLSSRMR